jgi:hypothetical protein
MRSFTPARSIKRRAFDVRKKRDPPRVSDAEIIAILQQWLCALRASGDRDIDGSLRAHLRVARRRQSPHHQSAPRQRPPCQRNAVMNIAAVYEAVTD